MTTNENIYIVTPKGDTLAIAFNPADTVDDLKAKVEGADGTPVADQRLRFAGNVLEGGHALSEYNVAKEATLDLGVRANGGILWWWALDSTDPEEGSCSVF